jgi:iron complex outermembrane recepter protein
MSKSHGIVVGVAAALGVVLPAAAQEGAEEPGGLEEVVVSAQYRQQSLQETPLAISALSGEDLQARNLTNVTQLDSMVPNAVISPLGAGYGSTVAAFVRGIGLGDNSLSFEPGVPIYVDDVYNGRPQGTILDLLDLERVEVLRGPQGTLFGKNAVGGAVRLISKKPTGDGKGYLEASTGSYDRVEVRGSWDVPLVADKLFARVSGSSKKRHGYFDLLDYQCVNGPGSLGSGGTTGLPAQGVAPINLSTTLGVTDRDDCVVGHLGGEDVQSARMALRFIGNDDVEFNFVGDFTHQNQEGPADKYTFINGAFATTAQWNTQVGIPVFGIPYDSRFLTNDPYTSYNSFGIDPLIGREIPNVNKVTHWGTAGTLEWRLTDAVNLKFINAFRKFSNSFGRDSDGSPLPVNPTYDTTTHEQFTSEVQLTGTSFEKLEWATGAFYYDAEDTNRGFVTLYPYTVQMQETNDVQDTKDWAVFAHFIYHWTDKLSTTAGVRYTDDEKSVTIFRGNFDGTIAINNVPLSFGSTRTSPKVGIDYKWTDTFMTYASFSTGFRGGGFGPRPSNALQLHAFEPEDLDSYEIGAKSELFDRRVRLNGDVFYSLYTNQQLSLADCLPCAPTRVPWFRTINTGKSRIWGVEAEVNARPIDAWKVEASLGYINYWLEDAGTTTLTARLPNGRTYYPNRTPKWNYGLSTEYTFALGERGTLTPHVDWTHQSRIYFNNSNGVQEAYGLLSARMTWTSPQETWSVAVFGTNLTDELYFDGKLALQPNLGREQGNVAAPREWGVSFRRSF